MISMCRAQFFALMLILVGFLSSAMTQNLDTHPMRGFMPNMDQLSSPVDNIDIASGKLHLQIPVGSLPKGSGGIDYDVSLEYDSHLYDLQTIRDYGYGYNMYQYEIPMPQSYSGGWKISAELIGIEPEVIEGVPFPYADPCSEAALPQIRYRAVLHDGSQHILYKKEANGPGSQNGLYYGQNSCLQSPAQTGTETYFTKDGSFLKYETYINGGASGGPSAQLFFPDGRRIVWDSPGIIKEYDANGNYIQHENKCYDTNGDSYCDVPYHKISRPQVSSEDGQSILIIHRRGFIKDNKSVNQIEIISPGPNGPVKYVIDMECLIPNLQIKTIFLGYDYNGQLVTTPFDPSFWVVKYIHMPLPNGDLNYSPAWGDNLAPEYSYEFRYQGEDVQEDGIGLLKYMRMPSGAQYQYSHSYESGGRSESWTIANGYYVQQKQVTYDSGRTLTWNFGNAYNGTTITNPDGGKTVYEYSSKSGDWDSNLVKKISEYDNGGILKGTQREKIWSYNAPFGQWWSDGAGFNTFVNKEIVTIPDENGAPQRSAITTFSYDKNGNIQSKIEYDWVAPAVKTGSVVKRKTLYDYYVPNVPDSSSSSDFSNAYWNAHNTDLWPEKTPRRLNALKRMTIKNGNDGAIAATEYVYDFPYSRGNATQEKRWDSVKSTSLPALGYLNEYNSQVLTRAYDSYGNLTEIYEPEVRTHITYDALGRYVTRVDKGYGTSSQRSMAYNWTYLGDSNQILSDGVAICAKTDEDNHLTTKIQYDNVGRAISTIDIDASGANIRKTTTEYNDADRIVTEKTDLRAFGQGELQKKSSYDMLGRLYLAQTSDGTPLQSSADGIKANTYYQYIPNIGKQVIATKPYRYVNDADREYTCTQYDLYNRVTEIAAFNGGIPGALPANRCADWANSTGITKTFYSADSEGSIVKVKDPAGKSRIQKMDVLGRLVKVIEDPSTTSPAYTGLNYQTDYTYDLLGNLTGVTQGVQTRAFTYSSLGRLLTATNPESGTASYTYNNSGDLINKIDARSISTTMTYDPLHRILTKSYSGGSAPNVTYDYYLAENASSPNIGQLRSVSSSVGSTFYTYNQMGKVAASTHSIAGLAGAATFAYDYYKNGALKSERYPSGRLVNYSIDDAGRTNKVDAGGVPYVDASGTAANFFTADGRLKQALLGNGLWETYNYQAPGTATEYMLGSTQGGFDKIKLGYNFSSSQNNGNVNSQTMMRNGNSWTQNYGYDGVNRLSSVNEANGPTPWSQSYGYDQYGNRYISAATAAVVPIIANEPDALSDFNTDNNRLVGVNYDAAGNQTAYGSFTLSYDAENRNTVVSASGSAYATYSYDGDGRRVKKLINGTGATTYYVYDAMGQMAAEYSTQATTTPGTSYMFTDMLGSVRTITDQSGNVVENYDYLPFGRMLSSAQNGRASLNFPDYPDATTTNPTSRTPQKFTGKERDAETGLDFFGARYYSPAQGRFTSVDSSHLSINSSDPQSWNRYIYANNNPLKFVDENGKWSTSIHERIIDKAFSGLTSQQRDLLKAASKHVDRLTNQTIAGSHDHAMRKPGENPDKALISIDQVIQIHEAAATNKQNGVLVNSLSDINDSALREFGLAGHTIMDITSPAHIGLDGKPLVNNGIPTSKKEIDEMKKHLAGEQNITPAQMDAAVKALREMFGETFGSSAAQQSAQPAQDEKIKKRRFLFW